MNSIGASAGRELRFATPMALTFMLGLIASVAQAQTAGLPSAAGATPTGEVSGQESTAAEKPSPDSAQLGEIVVTARRREENALKVPISISVMSDAKIAETGVKDLRDLSLFTPGLSVATRSSTGKADRSQTRLTFRGLSTTGGTIFIDGSPYAGNGTPDVTDVQRVEVLNGPQSVYFGRSTFSGAVNYVTKPPADHLEGRVSEELTTYGGTDTRAAVEGPLIADNLLNARVSGRYYTFGGQYVDGIHPDEKLGKQSTKSISVALSSAPAHNLKLSAYYSYRLDEDGPAPGASLNATATGGALNCDLGGTAGPYYCGELPKLSGINPVGIGTVNLVDDFIRNEFFGNARGAPVPFRTDWLDGFGLKRATHHAHVQATLTADSGWEAEGQASYNSTKYANLQGAEGRDTSNIVNPYHPATAAALAAACAVPGNRFCFTPVENRESTYFLSLVHDFSGSLRIATPQDKPVRATLGASYFRVWGPPQANLVIANIGRAAGGGDGLKLGVSTPAVYGGVYADVTDKLTLNAEARYQWDGISQQQTTAAGSPELHQVYQSFSPRLTINYNVTSRQLLYANWSRGYQPGGFNAILVGQPASVLAQLPSSDIAYGQEKLENFEIGHKASWPGNRLRTTLALYYMRWSNGQVTNGTFVNLPNGNLASISVVSNVGRVNLKGAEFTADWAATRDLTLSGTLNYADNKIANYIFSPNGLYIRNSTDVNGNQLDQVPRLSLSLSPSYTHQVSHDWRFSTRLDFSHQSKVFVDATDVAWRGARNLVNLRFDFTKSENFSIGAFVNNLFNDDTLIEAIRQGDPTVQQSGVCPPCYTRANPPLVGTGLPLLNAIYVGLPVKRVVGVRAGYNF